jgi:hypothetical protein
MVISQNINDTLSNAGSDRIQSPSRVPSTSPRLPRSSPLRNKSFSSADLNSDDDRPGFSLTPRRDSSSEIEDCLDDASGKRSHDPLCSTVFSSEAKVMTSTEEDERDGQIVRDKGRGTERIDITKASDTGNDGRQYVSRSSDRHNDRSVPALAAKELNTNRLDHHSNEASLFAPKPKPQFPRSAPLRPLTSSHSRSLLLPHSGGRQHGLPVGLDGPKARCQPHRQKLIIPKKSLRMSFDLGLTQSELARVS